MTRSKNNKNVLPTPTVLGGCSAGKSNLYIASDGLVYPCLGLAFPEFVIGDVKKESVVDIWENSPLLKKLRNLLVDDFEKCKTCKMKHICGGGCRGTSYYHFKSLTSYDPFQCAYFNVSNPKE